mgnify:CR=1 FL=1
MHPSRARISLVFESSWARGRLCYPVFRRHLDASAPRHNVVRMSGPLIDSPVVSTQWLADHLGADGLVVLDATVLPFTQPTGHRMPVLTNLFGTPARVARALDAGEFPLCQPAPSASPGTALHGLGHRDSVVIRLSY